jgi:hypothetical protein
MERTENIDKLVMLAPLPLAGSLSAGADMGAKNNKSTYSIHTHTSIKLLIIW